MPRRVLAAILSSAILLAACDDHTVTIRFDPDVGDELRYWSTVDQTVTTELDGDETTERDHANLLATQRIVGLDGDDVRVEVTVVRDGSTPRTFETLVDRASRLAAIEEIEGVPAGALGIDVRAAVPPDLNRPPAGPIEPGARWLIRTAISLDGVTTPVEAVGAGRITHLDVEDGVEVAVASVELRLPVRTVESGPDGTVTLIGTQFATTETAYQLDGGALHRETTSVNGDLSVIVEPPAGIDAVPVRGRIRYEVTTETTRLG